jgi:hypothetical protein
MTAMILPGKVWWLLERAPTGACLCHSQSVLQGGQCFCQKTKKGQGKITLAERICGQILAEFTKVAEKGRRKFSSVSCLTVLTNTLKQRQNFI